MAKTDTVPLVERRMLACTECKGIGWDAKLDNPCTYCGGSGHIGVAVSLGDPRDATIARLQAENEALRRERDGSMLLDLVALGRKLSADAAAREAAEAKAARLEEALKPFVKHYEPWMDGHADSDECFTHSRHTLGDLRRARAALEAK